MWDAVGSGMVRFTAALLLTLAASAPALAQPRCSAPRVLFAVDKSSSMLSELPAGGSKWQAARTALGTVAAGFEASVDFGLQVFPFPDRCEPGAITIDVGSNTATDLVDALGEPPPSGGNYTPMAQTLDVIASYAPMLDPEVDSHVVLITDGWQWCDPYEATTRFTPVASVERLRDLGLTVHVIGFGAGVDSLTLNRAAVAGGTALPGCDATLADPAAANHCYQQANDLTELTRALDGIARAITAEECDGWDNDCDGAVDEGFVVDSDGYTVCGTDPLTPGELDPTLSDCDDATSTTFPGAGEACNGVDDDCDGVIDPGCACEDGERRACGSAIGACIEGTQVCFRGAWGECEGGVTAEARELCDGVDEDCDGDVDEDADCGMGAVCIAGLCEPTEPEAPANPVEPEPEPTADAGPRPVPPMEGGCACDTTGPDASPLFGASFLLLLLAWRRRRPA